MSVGAWEPEVPQHSGAQREIDRELLQRCIAAVENSASLEESLKAEDRDTSYLMRLPAERWLEESEAWDNEQLWHLIQFFTLAEMQLPGWAGGAESPVIPLAKALRQRQVALDKDRLLWIRQHSDNRYLPYGPL